MKTLRRPMFRKGGNVGEGVMTGIVDRGNYSNGTPSLKINEEDIQDQVNLYRGGGQDMGSDPLTDFLLQFGPDLLSRTPQGKGLSGVLATAGAAAKEPIKDMIKNRRSMRSEDLALRARAIDVLGKDDLKKIRTQAKASVGPQLETETTEEYTARLDSKIKEFIDSTYAKSPFLKPPSPEENKRKRADDLSDPNQDDMFPAYAKRRAAYELEKFQQLVDAGVNAQELRATKLYRKGNLKKDINPGVYYDDTTDTYTRVGVAENGIPFIEQSNITFEELIQN